MDVAVSFVWRAQEHGLAPERLEGDGIAYYLNCARSGRILNIHIDCGSVAAHLIGAHCSNSMVAVRHRRAVRHSCRVPVDLVWSTCNRAVDVCAVNLELN